MRLFRGLVFFCLILAFSGLLARAEVINRIIATVDGDPITLYELKRFRETNVRARQASATDPGALLEMLILERITEKEVIAKGINVREEDVDRFIEGVKQQNRLSDEQLRQALAEQGLTLEQYRMQIRDDLRKMQLINREIRNKVNVTPEEVERYYHAHIDEFTTGAHTAVSHILLRVPEDASEEKIAEVFQRARDIHEQLRGGADFAELARLHSEDAAAKDGGRLGRFKKGEMLDEIEQQADALAPGEFSKPFRTRLGIHIVKVDERTGEGKQALESLATEIKEKLYQAALEERYRRWLHEDLRKQHHVELLP